MKGENILINTSVNYCYNIGDEFKDGKRNLIIISKEIRRRNRENRTGNVKWYKCRCLRCGTDDAYIRESHLKAGRGCPVCHGKQVSIGINDIPTTARWMVKYFQGGYDEAKLYTKCSNVKIYPVCPDCGKIRKKAMTINHLYQKKTINCICSDGFSYPEKFMFNVLKYLNVNFKMQLGSTTFKWCDNYRYDFYLNDYDCIIETHGAQHYYDCSWDTVNNIYKNDQLKMSLALENGIKHYIIIDCRKSDANWIKNSIIKSELLNLLNTNIDDIDWAQCETNSLNNIVKEVCNYKKDNPTMTTNEIASYFNIDRATVGRYLHKGVKLDWCHFGGLSKSVEVFDKFHNSMGIFNSASYISENSIKILGHKLGTEAIRRTCRGETKNKYGFDFKYIE